MARRSAMSSGSASSEAVPIALVHRAIALSRLAISLAKPLATASRGAPRGVESAPSDDVFTPTWLLVRSPLPAWGSRGRRFKSSRPD
jgi:hypothetical protein